MRIVNPSVEIIPRMDPLKKIELCGRVCYKSEDKITEDSAERFVRKLVERGHTSVLEHTRVIVPARTIVPKHRCQALLDRINYSHDLNQFALNGRDLLEINGSLDELANSPEADDYMSVRFVCDRAIANELVRHRVFSFSQQSSRYVTCQLPEFGGIEIVDPFPYVLMQCELDFFKQAEETYWKMIEAEAKPQEARNVLPLATKTELIMTGTYPQWAEMLKLRTAKAAHPQMRYLMRLLTESKDFPREKINYEL